MEFVAMQQQKLENFGGILYGDRDRFHLHPSFVNRQLVSTSIHLVTFIKEPWRNHGVQIFLRIFYFNLAIIPGILERIVARNNFYYYYYFFPFFFFLDSNNAIARETSSLSLSRNFSNFQISMQILLDSYFRCILGSR